MFSCLLHTSTFSLPKNVTWIYGEGSVLPVFDGNRLFKCAVFMLIRLKKGEVTVFSKWQPFLFFFYFFHVRGIHFWVLFVQFVKPLNYFIGKKIKRKNETIFERVQHIPTFKCLETIGCIITYSHSSQSITDSCIVLWCLALLPRVLLYNDEITFKDCYSWYCPVFTGVFDNHCSLSRTENNRQPLKCAPLLSKYIRVRHFTNIKTNNNIFDI